MSRCGQEMCGHWGGDGDVCLCALWGMEGAERPIVGEEPDLASWTHHDECDWPIAQAVPCLGEPDCTPGGAS